MATSTNAAAAATAAVQSDDSKATAAPTKPPVALSVDAGKAAVHFLTKLTATGAVVGLEEALLLQRLRAECVKLLQNAQQKPAAGGEPPTTLSLPHETAEVLAHFLTQLTATGKVVEVDESFVLALMRRDLAQLLVAPAQ